MSHVHNAGKYSGRRDFTWFSTFPQEWQVSAEWLLHAVVVSVHLSVPGERQKTVLCLYNPLVTCGVHSVNYKDHHRSALFPISQHGKWRYPWVGGGSKAAGVSHEVWAQACISLMTNQPEFCSLCFSPNSETNMWVVERTWLDTNKI